MTVDPVKTISGIQVTINAKNNSKEYFQGLTVRSFWRDHFSFLQNEALLLDLPFEKCNSGKYLVSLTDRQHEEQIKNVFFL